MANTEYRTNFLKAAKRLAKDADRRFQAKAPTDSIDLVATALTHQDKFATLIRHVDGPEFPNDAPDPTSNQPGTYYNGAIWVPSPDPHPFRTMTVSMMAAMEYGMANDGSFTADERDLAERVATTLAEILGPYFEELS